MLAAVQAARFQFETLRHGGAALARHLPELTERSERRARQVHAMVWEPLEPALARSRRVLVVPHGQLGELPFAALCDRSGPLAQRFEIAVVPSARWALHGLNRRAAVPRRALALGESASLPHTAAEARFVASLFDDGAAFVGREASVETLQARAPAADLIHLACHAQFRPDNPAFSALHLSDGALTAEQVEQLRLQAGVVVLSACDSALAGHGRGDERVGLVRAFMIAGAARVVAALWAVDDAIAELFMGRFYRRLRSGATPAAALRAAQLQTLRDHPHPSHWAAFTLLGGW